MTLSEAEHEAIREAVERWVPEPQPSAVASRGPKPELLQTIVEGLAAGADRAQLEWRAGEWFLERAGKTLPAAASGALIESVLDSLERARGRR